MIENRRMQYLYAMEIIMYSWIMRRLIKLNYRDYLKDELKYLKANMEVQIQSYEGETIGVELPKTVELEVTETEPGIKGDTATGATKSLQLKQVIL